ncbi:hypothetical protein P4H66_08200 [Paenibacillus dokdonensis]|uniref:Uncharacterized protein n=1 Tax=Paenibacillus dokdonensis TaxID=2567944 RepID=A0ABU6GJB9_9BACL|nr:hypothetical protein [Paenibacillus dokdonensis]MEC0239837.1 hypothetical protein [Paenibacillus dokdonensis]
MGISIRRVAAWAYIAAACFCILFIPGWEANASGHEHMHADASGEWTVLLGKLKRLAEAGTLMALTGLSLFRDVIWRAGDEAAGKDIRRIERAAAFGVLSSSLIAGVDSPIAIAKAVIAFIWLLSTLLVLLVSALLPSHLFDGSVLKEPIMWHVMGEEAHMSLCILEGSDGMQHVNLDV